MTITPARLIILGLILINVALVSSAQLLLKIGSSRVGWIIGNNDKIVALIKIALDPYIFFGTSCYVISLILWIYILSRTQLSVAYPLMSLSYVVVMLLSIVVMKETVNFPQSIGAFFIVIGISMIFLSK